MSFNSTRVCSSSENINYIYKKKMGEIPRK